MPCAAEALADSPPELGLWTSAGISIAHVSYAGGARLRSPALNHDIVVIDDFWHDAEALRQLALAGPFSHRVSESGFAFNDWLAERRHAVRIAELISRSCGVGLLDRYFEGRFVFETLDDEVETRKRVWIHYDRWVRVGVLYLSPHLDATGGTGFYRHRETGFISVHEADRVSNRRAIMGDSTNESAWELVASVPIRFNRMVLFSPHLFHQALCYFGNDAQDGRLYSIVAFGNSTDR